MYPTLRQESNPLLEDEEAAMEYRYEVETSVLGMIQGSGALDVECVLSPVFREQNRIINTLHQIASGHRIHAA
jgi:hypothetical protein